MGVGDPVKAFSMYKSLFLARIIKCTENNPEQFILKRDDSDTINAYKSNVRAIEKLWHENQQIATNEKIKEKYANSSWRKWQQDLINELKNEPDDRKIIWYSDPIGNSRKTYLSRYLQTLDGIRFENGRSLDIKFMYSGQRIVIFDLTRSQEYVSTWYKNTSAFLFSLTVFLISWVMLSIIFLT